MAKYQLIHKTNGKTVGTYGSMGEAKRALSAIAYNHSKGAGTDYGIICKAIDIANEYAIENECMVSVGIKGEETKKGCIIYHDVNNSRIRQSEVSGEILKQVLVVNNLLTLAERFNHADGFVADYSNFKQKKWIPRFFYYAEEQDMFCTALEMGSEIPMLRIAFKTKQRAEEFGNMYAALWREILPPVPVVDKETE